MTFPDKLFSLEEIEAMIEPYSKRTYSLELLKQLADCMRENERMRKMLEFVESDLSQDGEWFPLAQMVRDCLKPYKHLSDSNIKIQIRGDHGVYDSHEEWIKAEPPKQSGVTNPLVNYDIQATIEEVLKSLMDCQTKQSEINECQHGVWHMVGERLRCKYCGFAPYEERSKASVVKVCVGCGEEIIDPNEHLCKNARYPD